jgi:phosphate:Na+ symporter
MTYLLFNIFGAVFFVVVIYGLQLFISMPFMDHVINRGGIANIHFLFNFITSIILLPFSNKMADITGRLIGDDEESKLDKELATLDPRILNTPNIAIAQAQKVMFSMTDAIRENFELGRKLLNTYNEEDANKLLENEDFIDKCESALNEFLLKITSKRLASSERRLASELLNSISDLERIGDHCENILHVAQHINDEKIEFSEQGTEEINTILEATSNIIDTTFKAFKEDDLAAVSRIEPLAQTINEVKEIIKDHHVMRLQTGECGISGGFALVDILTSLDRIGSHCSNIGLHVAKKLTTGSFDEMHGHVYTGTYKTSEEYKALYCYYLSLYSEPITKGYNTSLIDNTHIEKTEKIKDKQRSESKDAKDKKIKSDNEKNKSDKNDKSKHDKGKKDAKKK